MPKNNIPYKIMLNESELPKQWYNIRADMKTLPADYIHPATHKIATAEDLSPIFAKALIEQELSTERFIDIPDEVMEKYKLFRSTPMHRAYNLEKTLGTPARIYYKYEGTNPSGSHKLNSAIPQAYYNKIEGIKKLTTETGAGQWGTALSLACRMYDLDCSVYMVKISHMQKPYRRSAMELFGAKVIASPSDTTEIGRKILAENPDTNGSLGDAISEAVEVALADPYTHYSLGSVLNHVVLHQTIIGLESKKQLEKVDEYPDIIIGCNGGGSNFSGISFPFLMDTLNGSEKGKNIKYIAVEAAACPKLTKGIFTYDFGDSIGMAPITMMYSLGHSFHPSGIHAGGLRYHGDSPLLSQLYHDGYINAVALGQKEVFDAALLFSQVEGIIPAPESSHAICQAINEANACKESGEEKVILFNLSGNGYFDMSAYDSYLKGEIHDDLEGINKEIERSQAILPSIEL